MSELPTEKRKDEFARLVAAYHDVFADPAKKASTEIVLAHLMQICLFWDDGYDDLPTAMGHKSGRRWVFLRIRDLLNLTAEQVDRIMEMRGELTDAPKSDYDPLKGSRKR